MEQIRLFLIVLCLAGYSLAHASDKFTGEQVLGLLLFQDKNLSRNRNQACSSCHALTPVTTLGSPFNRVPGFVDPANIKNGSAVSAGSFPARRGSLNAPSIAYAAYSPLFHWDENEGLYIGGQFWNGRSSNLLSQAKQPFLNQAEMAMPNKWSVVSRLKENPVYRQLFREIYAIDLSAVAFYPKSTNPQPTNPAAIENIYHHLAKAIGELEKSPLFNKFNAKFDYAINGKTDFTPIEKRGFELFEKKANCAACHISHVEKDGKGRIKPPLFTDFTYDNIGLPRNINIPNNPEPNLGLGGRSDIAKKDENGNEIGKHKVMSLRNVAITPPYGHNGVLSTLEQIVHFYNTRDTLEVMPDNNAPGFGKKGWPKPEIGRNVNHDELGDLQLTPEEERAIVAFLLTLTDDYPLWGKDPKIPPGTPSPYAKN